MVHRTLFLSLICLMSASSWSQPLAHSSSTKVFSLSGNLRLDVENSTRHGLALQDSAGTAMSYKSGLQAAAFSILLPGAGEYYVGEYWKAGSFLAAEVGLWVAYAVYTSKGDDQTDFFQEYADQHWSVVDYARFIERWGTTLNPSAQGTSGLVTSDDRNLPPWLRVDWARLNAAEASIGQKTGTYFSHQLPRRPDQQYYELIGKYPQFNPGWDDADNVNASNFYTDLTKRFRDYSEMRGKANDFYNIASTAAKLIVLNHVLSALDAAWSAAHHNKTFKLEAHVSPIQRDFGVVEFVPTVKVSVRF